MAVCAHDPDGCFALGVEFSSTAGCCERELEPTVLLAGRNATTHPALNPVSHARYFQQSAITRDQQRAAIDRVRHASARIHIASAAIVSVKSERD